MNQRPITEGQKKIIWTIVRKNGIQEDVFRERLIRQYGTESTRKLTIAQAEEVIRFLKVVTGQEYQPHNVRRTWGITDKQIGKVKQMAFKMGWVLPDEGKDGRKCVKVDQKRIDGMVYKMFSPKNRLELLNKTEATKLIIGMERLSETPQGVRNGISNYR